MPISISLFALLAPIPLALAPLAPPAPAAAEPVAQDPAELVAQDPDPEQAFREKIEQARRIGDSDQIGKVMKSDIERARNYVVETAVKMGAAGSPELASLLNDLVKGWKRGPGGDFASNMQRYYELMDPATRAARAQIKAEYDPVYTNYVTQANREQGEARNRMLLGLGAQLEQLGDAFAEVGDKFFASDAYYAAAWASDVYAVGEGDAELARVSRAYTKCAALRDEIDLKDDRYIAANARSKELDAVGYDGGLTAEEAANVTPGIELGQPRTLSGTVRVVEDLVAMPQPSYSADPAFLTWSSVYLTTQGSTASLQGMERSPTFKRTSSSAIEVIGSDGVAQEVVLKGKRTLVETTVGNTPMPWAFELQIGGNQDFFQGIQANLQPDQNNLGIYIAPASGMVYDLDGVELVVFDTNMDGAYGSWPIEMGYSQIPEGRFQPEIDAMQIDGAKQLVPFSEFVQVDDAWYKLEPQAQGRNLVVTPAVVQTGELSLEMKGAKPAFCVVRGRDKMENVFVDLTSSRRVEVPIGQYQLYYGALREGKRRDSIEKALMLPGKTTPLLSVRVDEVSELELGSKFSFSFEPEAESGEVFVEGRKIVVRGAGGELYTRFWNTRPQPEVFVRAVGSSKPSADAKMQLVNDPQSLSDIGYQKAWFPLDLTLEHKHGSDPVEVRLTQKKMDLFGSKIESEWTPAK